MEMDGEPMACSRRQTECADAQICQNCISSTRDYKTGKLYCLDVSWFRIVFFGARPVLPTDTCRKIALRRGMGQRGR